MRRTFDILFAVIAILAFSPLLLVIAIAIAMDSPGNPFYLAQRIGKGGRPFRMWKFRTMVKDADKRACITSRNDRRITRIGAILRKTKLDELPQVINLLLGDVTLVGPRPEAPQIVARYTDAQRAVLDVTPGITGCVQLESGEESEIIPDGVDAQNYYVDYLMDRKIRRDLEYTRTRSSLTDARILGRTAVYVLRAAFGRCPSH